LALRLLDQLIADLRAAFEEYPEACAALIAIAIAIMLAMIVLR